MLIDEYAGVSREKSHEDARYKNDCGYEVNECDDEGGGDLVARDEHDDLASRFVIFVEGNHENNGTPNDTANDQEL